MQLLGEQTNKPTLHSSECSAGKLSQAFASKGWPILEHTCFSDPEVIFGHFDSGGRFRDGEAYDFSLSDFINGVFFRIGSSSPFPLSSANEQRILS